MSMNLYFKANGHKIDLFQTPTHITYMCLMGTDGPKVKVTGAAAKRAMYCYIEYLKGTLNGVVKATDMADYNERRGRIMDEANRITSILETCTKFVAYTV